MWPYLPLSRCRRAVLPSYGDRMDCSRGCRRSSFCHHFHRWSDSVFVHSFGQFFSALSCRKCTAGVKAVYKQSCRRWNIFHVSGRQGKDLQKQDQCRVQPAGDQPEVLPAVFLCACIIDIHVTVRTDDGNRLAVYPYSCKPEDQPQEAPIRQEIPSPLDFGSSNRALAILMIFGRKNGRNRTFLTEPACFNST